jgi:phage baseplate assembly protein W
MKRYKDIDLSLRPHPITKDILPLIDADAVKRAVKLLVMTNYNERPFHPERGSNVYFQLFENFTPFTKIQLERAIKEVVSNLEPRASILGVNTSFNESDNSLSVDISFSIINLPDPIRVSFNLERVR